MTDLAAPIEAPAEQPEEQDKYPYWAKAPADELANHLAAKILEGDQAQSGSPVRNEIQNAYRNYFGVSLDGLSPSAGHVSRAGALGERAEYRINYSRALASAKHQIVVGPKVAWSCTAASSDYRAMADTVLGAKILEVYWKERGVEQNAVDCAESAIYLGEEFLFTPWDPELGDEVMAVGEKIHKTGDVAYIVVPTWDVLRDPTARSWDDLSWLIVRTWELRYDVVARYPDFASDIMAVTGSTMTAIPNGTGNTMSQALASDFIPVYRLFHKRKPALPMGRESVFVGGKVVHDEPRGLSYKHIPLHRMAVANLKGTPFAYTPYWETLGIQEATDSIHSSLVTNITTFGNGLISAEEGSAVREDIIANGPSVLYRKPGSAAPTAVAMPSAPKEAFNYIASIKADQRQLMGLNDVSLGQPDTADMNGTAFALLASMAIQANSTLQANYVRFVREVGRSTLQILQQRLTVERKIALAGVNSKGLVKQETYSGKSIAAVEDVIVEIGNPLQQTAAGRYQIAEMNLEKGFIRTPEQLQLVLDTGRLDPQTQALRNQLLLIASENEDMAKGVECVVSMYDHHTMHVPEHIALLADPDVRKDKRLVDAIQNHIAKHDELWHTTPPDTLMLAGINPPAPPMAPPGAPPGAGGPPPPATPDAGATQPQGPADMVSAQDQAAGVPLPGLPNDPTTGAPPEVMGVNPLDDGKPKK